MRTEFSHPTGSRRDRAAGGRTPSRSGSRRSDSRSPVGCQNSRPACKSAILAPRTEFWHPTRNPSSGQDTPHSRCRDRGADAVELADDPPVSQRGFSLARRTINATTDGSSAGRPGRRCAYDHRRATSRRCQRGNASSPRSSPTPHAAASDSTQQGTHDRPASASAEQTDAATPPARDASTRISSSFDPLERPKRTTSDSRPRTTAYANDQSK
jgi:hypothetical protein